FGTGSRIGDMHKEQSWERHLINLAFYLWLGMDHLHLQMWLLLFLLLQVILFGRNSMDNALVEFEAKSARDGAW
ncbi:hypothetical protein GW17_00020284, partial [Ensete ventricosum]